MKKTIFEFSEYKPYIESYIHQQRQSGHGFKSKIAEALQCNTSYVSQVLNGTANFSMEQADDLNTLLGHTKEESIFFLLLVQRGRAGTVSLRKIFDEQIELALQKRLVLKDRLEVKKTLSIEDQAIYYSHWYFSAIHVLVSIPQFKTKTAVAEYLKLPLVVVSSVLEFLVSVGLVTNANGDYTIGISRIFLGHDSPMITKHHTNWRIKVVQSMERQKENLHYSSTISLSKSDILKVQAQLVDTIEQIKGRVKNSKEEELYCFALDFFRVE